MDNPYILGKDLPFSFSDFTAAIPEICARDTAAANGDGWTPENPTWGHCAVVALWEQNFYGGHLLRTSLEGTEFARVKSHYYNRLANGMRDDLTAKQFQGRLEPGDLPFKVMARAHVIGGADTRARYALFGVRLLDKLLATNPLMKDPIYYECIYQALLSPCQKKGVGAVLYSPLVFLADHNTFIEGLEHLCKPKCIRFSIPSRTNALIGACGHAEERVIWPAMQAHYNLSRCEIFVTGVDTRGLPSSRPFPEFTCLRCALTMRYAGLAAVNVVYQGKQWIRQTVAEALASALKYALGERSV